MRGEVPDFCSHLISFYYTLKHTTADQNIIFKVMISLLQESVASLLSPTFRIRKFFNDVIFFTRFKYILTKLYFMDEL
jgi:hypothetical protein